MWFRRHRLALVTGLSILLGALLLVGSALAQTPTPTPTKPGFNFGDAFLGHLAKNLGIDQGKLVEQAKAAARSTVDDGVQQGAIPAERAQRLKEQIDQGDAGFFHGKFFGHPAGRRGFAPPGPRPGLAPFGKLGGAGLLDAAAPKLGLTTEQLSAEIRGGKSLAQIAQDRGVSREDLRAAILDAQRAQVNQAVQKRQLTQEQADRILAAAPTQIDRFIDATPRVPRGPKARPNGPKATPTP